jgi:ferrous iron transport protein B
MMAEYTVALAGNPNAGKSTIFNLLTGARQHVGNWPGKTVEKKEGTWIYNGTPYTIVDLPGTYSLTAYSMEEIIARDYIIEAQPDVVVVVVDAANLERNLYLVLQILEMGAKVVLALNMMDVVAARGIRIDVPKLSSALEVPVVRTTANRGQGLDQLKAVVAQACETVARVRPPQSAEAALS